MTEKKSDKWVSLTLSVLVHGTIVALLVWGFWSYKRDTKTPDVQLAIEATVVDAKTLPSDVLKPLPPTSREVRPPVPEAPVPEPQVEPAPPKPEPPPPEPEVKPEPPPPTPPPDDTEKREKERKAEEQRLAAERAEKQRVEKERADKERVEKERAEKERQEKERVAKEKADREKAEKERAEREKAEQLAQQRAAEERQRQADLRAQLANEERISAVRSSAVAQQYFAQIRARVERAWIRPPSARPGLSCQVRITQLPSGEVVKADVIACNGDQVVRESIETAVYNASPLPQAPDPALFERVLVLNFRPED